MLLLQGMSFYQLATSKSKQTSSYIEPITAFSLTSIVKSKSSNGAANRRRNSLGIMVVKPCSLRTITDYSFCLERSKRWLKLYTNEWLRLLVYIVCNAILAANCALMQRNDLREKSSRGAGIYCTYKRRIVKSRKQRKISLRTYHYVLVICVSGILSFMPISKCVIP